MTMKKKRAVMITEQFENHLITYSLGKYWNTFKPEVVDVWPCSGRSNEIDIKERFIKSIKL